jgi:hypothetical protein
VSPRRPLGFLNERTAFVRRFVLAQVLGPPRGRTVRLPRTKAPPPEAQAKKPG